MTPAPSNADGQVISTTSVKQALNFIHIPAESTTTTVTPAPDLEPQPSTSAITVRKPLNNDPHPNLVQTRSTESAPAQCDSDVFLVPTPQNQGTPQALSQNQAIGSRSQTLQCLEPPQVARHSTISPPPTHPTIQHETPGESVQITEPNAKRRKLNISQQHEKLAEQATNEITLRSAQERNAEDVELATIPERLDNLQESRAVSNKPTAFNTRESSQRKTTETLELAPKRRKVKNTQQSIAGPEQSASGIAQEIIEDETTSAVKPAAKRRKLNNSQRPKTRRGQTSASARVGAEHTTEGDCESAAPNEVTHTDSSSRATKPKQKATTSKVKRKKRMEQAAEAVVATAVRSGRKKKTSTRTPRTDGEPQSRRGRKRAVTPEDAETVEIIPATLKMSDLCRDLHYGKKSIRSEEIRVFEIEEAAKKKEREERGEGSEVDENDEEPQRATRLQAQPSVQQTAPQMQIVNGMLVLVEGSNRVDRHAEARVNQIIDEQAITHESSLSHRTNQRTNMKVSKRETWDEELTDLFYDGLRMFGTDFGMIARMFPGRSRRTIKLKFTKEEKVNEAKIDQILRHERKPVDLEEFSRLSKTTYDDVNEHKRDLEEDRRHLEEEQAKQKEAIDEIVRRREDDVAAESGAIGGDSAKENEVVASEGNTGKKGGRAKEPKNKGKSQKSKKNRQGQPPNSEGTVEVLGPIT